MPQRPNIVFLFADQLQAFALGCLGNPDVRTPHIDRLAAEGIVLRNAYTNYPVCSPFRANLFSGLYTGRIWQGHRNQCRVPADSPTFAGVFGDAGYRTAFVGKWHLGGAGNVPTPVELRADFAGFSGYQCYNGFHKDVVFFDEDGRAREFACHRTNATTDVALERLGGLARRGDPFALVVAYQNPHYPVQPDPEYAALYAGKPVTRRPNVVDIDPYTQTFSPPSPKPVENDPDWWRYGNNLDEYIRLYYAMVTQLDANVGRLLAALEEHGVAGETIVLFTSDHGDMHGSHGQKNKSLAWEESSRIPLVMRVPGGPRGVVREAPVSGIDFFPTLADLAGLPPVAGIDGTSFAPLAMDREADRREPVFAEGRDWCMVRRGPWKLVARRAALLGDYATQECAPAEPINLFDLDIDPYEMHDRVADPACASVRDDLFSMLIRWHDAMVAAGFRR